MIRVVSLVPSITETLLAWGIAPVACTRFCEQPGLRHVGGTKDPDVVGIVGLRPDLVVVDREENRKEDAAALIEAGLDVHITHVTTLDDVEPTMLRLAERVGIIAALGPVPPWPDQLPRMAFVPIWRRPWMTINGDTYGSSILATCGVVSAFADHADRYPTVTLESAAALGPDLVILPSEPYAFSERHVAEVRGVAADVRLIDGRDLFWWGVRTPSAQARLAQALA